MSTPRRPLQEISGNSTIRKELSPFQRGLLVGAANVGCIPAQISKDFNVPDSTVQYTLNSESLSTTSKSNPRKGRPLSYTPRKERLILRFVRKNLKSTYNDIRKECRVNISTSTIKKILKKHSISN
jgi:hypothetical protein